MVNAWMNNPAGFSYNPQTGAVTNVDPIAAMFNRAWLPSVIHMTIAAYLATGIAVAAVYAWGMLHGRRDDYHRKALAIALVVTVICAPLQFISGDTNARFVAENQTTKFAAMEGQFQTQAGAPLRIGGFPDPRTGQTNFAIEIPGMLSWLGYGNTSAVVKGLNDVPVELRPATEIIHPAFQVMVGSGSILLLVALASVIYAWRKRRAPDNKWLLRAILVSGPLGFLAIEAGWVVTELGRQPFIIYNVMRTADAVTTAPGLIAYLVTFVALYLLLAAMVVWFLRQIANQPAAQKEGSSLATA
jgi:cytochrome bd ubiquinol oxidase subunit I